MKDYIEVRIKEESNYILSTGATIRIAAKKFGVCKSTVHKDMVERLLKINPQLHESVKNVIENNKSERHIRGGASTKLLFSNN